jgi:hypothetical protein
VQHRTSEGHQRLLTARSWRTAICQVPRGITCPMAGISSGRAAGGRAPRLIRGFGCGPRQASGGSRARGCLCRGAAG